jgi:hypothetical protein
MGFPRGFVVFCIFRGTMQREINNLLEDSVSKIEDKRKRKSELADEKKENKIQKSGEIG